MKKFILLLTVLMIITVVLAGCQQPAGERAGGARGNEPSKNKGTASEYAGAILLATTTSTYDSGLLHELLPLFKSSYGIEVEVLSVGTGQAIAIGKRGDCDIILVHARDLEDQFVEEGYGTERWDVMCNDFVFLGPAGDPGQIGGSASLDEALNRMVEHIKSENIVFTSRGDNSGTHNKEKSLWPLAGIDAEGEEWYASLGQGMGETLITTNEMRGYTMTDRGTYLSMKDKLPNLEIVFEGDEALANSYGIIPVNPEKHRGVHYEEAMLLVEFFISDEVQQMIGEFGTDTFGHPLFFPDAK